jgi:hypothetical protein
MRLKLITAVAAIGFILGVANSSSAATWRSQSGKTVIPNLDSICWGNDTIDSVRTVFGSGSYTGSIFFDYVRTRGCVPGDTIVGNFTLYNASNHCSGLITVNWRRNNNAYIQWDITNRGSNSGCPVSTTHWEINTYPVAQKPTLVTSPTGAAIVFAPPSNVRATPNGAIICSVRSVTTIDIYGSINGWYKTDVCGSMGYIHHSQIRF